MTEATCLSDFTALEVMQAFNSPSETFSHRLRSKNAGGIDLTKAALIGKLSEGHLSLRVSFEDEHDVGLPYNVNAILVTDEQGVLFWKDFTQLCRTVGAAVFPGRSIELGKIKDLSEATQQIRIIVWGKRN